VKPDSETAVDALIENCAPALLPLVEFADPSADAALAAPPESGAEVISAEILSVSFNIRPAV